MKKHAVSILLLLLLLALTVNAGAADIRDFDKAYRAFSGKNAEWVPDGNSGYSMKAGAYTVIRLSAADDYQLLLLEIESVCTLEDDASAVGRELSQTARNAALSLYTADGISPDTVGEEIINGLKPLFAHFGEKGTTTAESIIAGRDAILTLSFRDGMTIIYTLRIEEKPDRADETEASL